MRQRQEVGKGPMPGPWCPPAPGLPYMDGKRPAVGVKGTQFLGANLSNSSPDVPHAPNAVRMQCWPCLLLCLCTYHCGLCECV